MCTGTTSFCDSLLLLENGLCNFEFLLHFMRDLPSLLKFFLCRLGFSFLESKSRRQAQASVAGRRSQEQRAQEMNTFFRTRVLSRISVVLTFWRSTFLFANMHMWFSKSAFGVTLRESALSRMMLRVTVASAPLRLL